ncbi:unnamed protein product, partial [marine sediment metagenome]
NPYVFLKDKYFILNHSISQKKGPGAAQNFGILPKT